MSERGRIGRRALLGGAALSMLPACPAAQTPRVVVRSGEPWLDACVRPSPGDGALALYTPPHRESTSAIYDDALVTLLFLRRKKHAEAGRILGALERAQAPDGSIPFNVAIDGGSAMPYVRCGALAWVGYAAVQYLDGERGGPHRDAIVTMAHRIGGYILRRRSAPARDPRALLVTGGRGSIHYDHRSGQIMETFVDGDQTWVSTEHNVDAFFLLRALGRVTGDAIYKEASARLGETLVERTWSAERGQLWQGVGARGPDRVLALDCATWGGLMLLAMGDRARAERALAAADSLYVNTTRSAGGRKLVRGHRPYATGPVVEDAGVRARLDEPHQRLEWPNAGVVWPEGSAGVAVLAARLGHRTRAVAVLDELEELRTESGALPTASVPVPLVFDDRPGIAGTAWVELARRELAEGATLWV